MVFKNNRQFGDDYPFNSKSYPFSKTLKKYSTRNLGRAFFSDGNVQVLGMPLIYDHIEIFDNFNLGFSDEAVYYKSHKIKLVIYTLDNYKDLLDKYPKADLEFDEICIFFCLQDQKVITKIKLGESLQKYSRFTSVQDTASFSFIVPLSQIQQKTITTKSIIDLLSTDAELFTTNFIQDFKTIALNEVFFLDREERIIFQKFDPNLGQCVSSLLYGEQVKIRVTADQVPENTTILVKLVATANQTLDGIEKMEWTVKFHNNIAETPYFTIPLFWFDEQILKYNYPTKYYSRLEANPKAYTTTFRESPPVFSIEVSYEKSQKLSPKNNPLLIPNSYRRNYEELIGSFQKDNSTYEDHFIALNPEIEKLVNKFVNYIYHFDDEVSKHISPTKNHLSKARQNDIEYNNLFRRVEKDATELWKTALIPFAKSNLPHCDDRPLYWARLKMQSQLKRLPLFKEDINYEKSQVKEGTKLEEIITLLEEKSRHYTDVDFGYTLSKKILVTGFDPFFLNSLDHNSQGQNINQSNPSGCVALYLEANRLQNHKIQTMIIPVRYTDFDNSQNPEKGQGTGIIEKYIKPWIKKVDMIITISQGNPKEYNLDVFATLRRGGISDNMNFTREKSSKSMDETAPETLVSTLPDSLTQGDSKARFYGIYHLDHKTLNATKENYPTVQIDEAPGGNFLSNEIFYRVAKLRNENNPSLPTGHFHVPKLQIRTEEFSQTKTIELLNQVIQTLKYSEL